MGLLKRLGRKGQTGQSLVILAIGFLALLGFVGIVTDVSVLFIRYSTMRRAVDAAAIAAAGQMRRVQDTKLTSLGIADGQATSIANLNLAARQFIEVYGLNPKSVLVETCRSQQVAVDSSGNAVDSAGRLLYITVTDPITLATSKVENPAADQETLKRYNQLCTSDELKLVRVTAQIDAPTIFLRLLGYPTVTLTSSAISQTAVIDVVMIFDVSESMLNETTYTDWDNIPGQPPKGVRYMPPYISSGDRGDPNALYPIPGLHNNPWIQVYQNSETALNSRINGGPGATVTNPSADPDFSDQTIAFEPTTALNVAPTATQWQQFGSAASPVGRVEPRVFCRVRAYQNTYPGYSVNPTLRQDYFNFFNSVYQISHPGEDYSAQFGTKYGKTIPNNLTTNTKFSLFVPMYNYFGCCNDPDGNFAFDDLICQPFKQARDAAHAFLDRLDFLRGDRVAFVTFDRQASIIDPDGDGPQASMIETQENIQVDPSCTVQPCALLRKGADHVLDDVVGVRAEASVYSNKVPAAPTTSDGMWHGLYDSGLAKDYQQLLDTPVGSLVDNPVQGACPYDTATLPWDFIPPAKYTLNGNQRKGGGAIIDDVVTVPTWYQTQGIPTENPPVPGDPMANNSRYRSYEYRASCAGTNIGAGLQGGSATLFNEGRREGAVWIMVMLSDGAAGASNPITKYHGTPIIRPDPYAVVGPITTTGKDSNGVQLYLPDPDPITGLPVQDAFGNPLPVPPQVIPSIYSPIVGTGGPAITNPNNAGAYGIFGLCPYGTQTKPSRLLSSDGADKFPLCDDVHPETRHFCGTAAQNPDSALEADPNCFNYYDVDDYARDWADFIGLAQLPGATVGGNTGRVGDELLPSIFTIGFGINFNDHSACAATDYACIRGTTLTYDPSSWPGFANQGAKISYLSNAIDRNADYLGEELLRYIADVGDNNQIDSDWWQFCELKNSPVFPASCRDDGGTNPIDRIGNPIDITSPNWGSRGPCESPYDPANPNARGSTYLPKPPETACGNYYVAATGSQLEAVFDQIASRMFTRLSQ